MLKPKLRTISTTQLLFDNRNLEQHNNPPTKQISLGSFVLLVGGLLRNFMRCLRRAVPTQLHLRALDLLQK